MSVTLDSENKREVTARDIHKNAHIIIFIIYFTVIENYARPKKFHLSTTMPKYYTKAGAACAAHYTL